MKKFLKWGSLLAVLILSLFICSDNMIAKTHEDDHVRIQMHLEEYKEEEHGILVRVAVTNIGVDAIEDVEISSVLPLGVKLLDGEKAEAVIETIAPGMTEELAFHTTFAFLPIITTIIGVGIGIYVIALIIFLIILIRRRINAKKAATIALCFILAASPILEPISVYADEGKKVTVDFTKKIKANNQNYSFKTKVVYHTLPAIKAKGSELTRREWIADLLKTIGYEDDFDSDLILMSYASSIFPEGEADEPKLGEKATREFAAVTAVKALGFLPAKDLQCEDSKDIKNLKDTETAVALDLFRLEDNHFYPKRVLTNNEAKHALSTATDILSRVKDSSSDKTKDDITYNSGVVEIDEDIAFEVKNNKLILEEDSSLKNLKKGDIIVLADMTPYKIKKISLEDDEYVIETETPEIQEVLDYIDVQGTGTVDFNKLVRSDDKNSAFLLTSKDSDIDVQDTITGPGTVSFEAKKKLPHNLEVYGQINFNLPSIDYKADVDFGFFSVDVNDAYLKINQTTTLDAGLKTSTDGTGNAFKPTFDWGNIKGDDGLITLGEVPVVGVPGVTAYIELAMKYEISGQVGFVYTVGGTSGVQIINNRIRMIDTLESDLDVKAIEASVKLGPQVAALLEICHTWPLIDVNLSIGGAGTGSLVVRDTENCCIDAGIYVYGEFSALERSFLADWLKISYKNEFWNSDHTPWSRGLHFENLKLVPACTFNEDNYGTIVGLVAEATDRTDVIKNATIRISKKGSTTIVDSTTSDENGNYTLSLMEGEYTLMVSSPGYISYTSNITVTGNQEQYVETLLLIDNENKDKNATAGGSIINALTGDAIEGAKITVRKGWNQTSGTVIKTLTTDENGAFQLEAKAGSYTLQIQKEEFISSHINITLVPGATEALNGTLVPEGSSLPEGDLRVVLTWGRTPADLDSHLIGPQNQGSSYFHIYFDRKTYSASGTKYADLDLDDTTSYGPETSTVYEMNDSGIYSFYVHDYTNKSNSSSTSMSNSGAKVYVYVGETLCATYNIPAAQAGNLWHVFNFDARTHSLIPVNKYVDGYDTSYWN